MLDAVHFTVIDPVQGERKLLFRSLPDKVRIDVQNESTLFIDRQQIFELGSLLLALGAGETDDTDSAPILLEGYGDDFYRHGKAAAADLHAAFQDYESSKAA